MQFGLHKHMEHHAAGRQAASTALECIWDTCSAGESSLVFVNKHDAINKAFRWAKAVVYL